MKILFSQYLTFYSINYIKEKNYYEKIDVWESGGSLINLYVI